jgi:DNA-directed RNA polymerase specialized sigma24 family protein
LGFTPEQFEALLAWLDSDRERAGVKYKVIHSGMIRIFVSKGFNDAEDLADVVVNRVIDHLPELKETFVGEPARFFHGVARNIIRERYRRKEITVEVTAVTEFVDPIISTERECLNSCLQVLTLERRELVLEYYQYDGHDKVQHRKLMAKRLGITEGALRGRIHQIKSGLEQCVKQCANRKRNKTMPKGH